MILTSGFLYIIRSIFAKQVETMSDLYLYKETTIRL